MTLKNTLQQYGIITKLLHWFIALLIIIQFCVVYWVIWVLPEKSPTAGFLIGDIHKPFGVLIFALGAVAILWRLLNKKPTFPNTMPTWEKIAAHLTHWLLYLAMLLMPITGVLMSEAAGYSVGFFGLFELPMVIPTDKAASQFYFKMHEVISFVLLALVILHIAAALKHQLYDKDGILKRMWF